MARKILLADDSVTAQNMGRKILIDAGYDVITVNNGSAALKKISEQKPDLIVLDVYMPGYSGLEVCQRVKEDEETARIPVLLTVGKLEPFKPEEARKARADAYIVKPFEASELLVALTKLEDKVVPPPGPGKAGRAAKPNAVSEQSFGDTESGWKKRLRFPTPASKAVQPPAQAADKPASEELPKDITPEEIAAIAAAAAQVGGAAQETATSSSSSSPDSATPGFTADRAWPKPESAPLGEPTATEASASAAEIPPVTFASAMEAQAETSPAPVVEVSQPAVVAEAVAAEPSAASSAMQEAKAEESQSAAPVVEPTVPATVASDSGAPSVPEVVSASADADVIAALQSLSPANGDGVAKADTAAQSAEPNFEDNPMAAVLAAVASAEMAAVPSGPRWVAESVAVDAEEGTLILEREMEKAYAAFAAADGARASFAGASTEPTAMAPAEASVVGMAATDSVREAALSAAPMAVADSATVTPSIPQPESAAGAPLAESRSEEPAAQAEAATAAATIAQDAAAQDQAQIASPPPTIQTEEPAAIAASEAPADAVASTVVPAPVEVAESHAQPEVAASAAAGAPGSGDWHSVAAAASMPYPAPELPGQRDGGASDGTDRKEDAELNAANAAAWANWRQIRETVVAASSQVADAAAATFKDIRHEAPAKPQSEGASTSESSSSSSASEATAIASIVESVLSELKPKLVEEIARKMASDKKKE